MIKIGVNENIILSSTTVAEKDGKKWLTIGFTEAGTESSGKASSISSMLEDSTDTAGDTDETSISIFMPNMVKYGTEEIKSGEDLLAEMLTVKNQLHHILKRYVVSTSIKWAPFEKTSINAKDDNDVLSKLAIATVYEQVFTNLIEQFAKQVGKFAKDASKPSRLLLVRQSAAKAYGTFRKKFLNDQPFFESMDIPKNQSKLLVAVSETGSKTKYHEPVDGFLPRFTDYEISKGLDNPIRVEAESDKLETTSEETSQVANLFTAGATDDAPTFDATVAA